MSEIKVYTDEDTDIAVSRALKLRGISASTTLDQNRCASSDERQLEYAATRGAVLLTHNVQDFPRIHYEFINGGKHHCGIIIVKQVSVGEIIKRFLYVASVLSADNMADSLEYLSNW